jgi:hypothetical protein
MLKSVKRKLGNSSTSPISNELSSGDVGAGTQSGGSHGQYSMTGTPADTSPPQNVEPEGVENDTVQPVVNSTPQTNQSTDGSGSNTFKNGIVDDRTDSFLSENDRAQPTKGQIDLKSAVKQFETNYLKFAKNHKEFITIEDDLYSALQLAQHETNIYRSAELFRKEISNVLSVRSLKENAGRKKAMSRVGRFLGKLYPVANVSLRLAGVISEVYIFATTLIPRALGLYL